MHESISCARLSNDPSARLLVDMQRGWFTYVVHRGFIYNILT